MSRFMLRLVPLNLWVNMFDLRSNILLIKTDQQRGDCLSLDPHAPSCLQTPNLDWVTHIGTHFRRGYSDCPSCIPIRLSSHLWLITIVIFTEICPNPSSADWVPEFDRPQKGLDPRCVGNLPLNTTCAVLGCCLLWHDQFRE